MKPDMAADDAEKALADASAKSRAAEREVEAASRRVDDLTNRRQQIESNLANLDIETLQDQTSHAATARKRQKNEQKKAAINYQKPVTLSILPKTALM